MLSVYAHISPGLRPSKGKPPPPAPPPLTGWRTSPWEEEALEAKPHLRGQAKPSESCPAVKEGAIAGNKKQLITPSTMKRRREKIAPALANSPFQ